MSPLQIVTTLGPLLTSESRGLSVSRRFSGPWIASWAENERGDDYAWSASTDPAAALDALADTMVRKARARAAVLERNDDVDDQELAGAIRLALVEIEEAQS